jgi:hypothetical protein
LAQVAEAAVLLDVYEELRPYGGPAPGVDGLTYAKLGRSEAAGILRVVATAVRHGSYRPQPARLVTIPKPSGGQRTLAIRSLCDRVVAAALHRVLMPLWETVFLDESWGFRPHRHTWGLLATLKKVVERNHSWVLVVDDVRTAFDTVRIDDVLADHRRYVQDAGLLQLIDSVLRGGDPGRMVGIAQGCPYSPVALNVRLHHAHDLGMQKAGPPLWLRYADNLAYVSQSVPEGKQMREQARNLLEQAGFTLKGEAGPPVDLRQGQTVELLGFSLRHQEDHLTLSLGQQAWNKLHLHLEKAHQATDPTQTALQVVQGWIAAQGPALANWRDASVRVLETSTRYGFREIGLREDVARQMKKAYGAWLHLCRQGKGNLAS